MHTFTAIKANYDERKGEGAEAWQVIKPDGLVGQLALTTNAPSSQCESLDTGGQGVKTAMDVS